MSWIAIESNEQLLSISETYKMLGSIYGFGEEHPLRNLCIIGKIDPNSAQFEHFIDAAKQYSLVDEDPEEEANFSVDALAVAIPVSDDILYYFLGNGLKLQDEEFAFRETGKKEIRTSNLRFARYVDMVMDFKSLTDPVLASEEDDVSQYLSEHLRKTSSKKGSDNSRIVNILDDNNLAWEDGDLKTNAIKMIEKLDTLAGNNEFVLNTGNDKYGQFLIEVKGGPEAAYRYIANKTGEDLDYIKKFSDILDKQEITTFFEDMLADNESDLHNLGMV